MNKNKVMNKYRICTHICPSIQEINKFTEDGDSITYTDHVGITRTELKNGYSYMWGDSKKEVIDWALKHVENNINFYSSQIIRLQTDYKLIKNL
jgi:hypothetical protein